MHLAKIDAVRTQVDATNNDVILTIVSGALHRWHTSRGADVKELRVLVPVNLRTTTDAAGGNRLALLALSLPIGEPHPLRRLRLIQERMGRVKADQQGDALSCCGAHHPGPADGAPGARHAAADEPDQPRVHERPGAAASLLPRRPGDEAFYAYAPLVGDHPIAIALYSYRDMVHVGLDVDPLAMGDLEHFRDALAESYAEVINVGRDAAPPLRRPA